MRKARSTAAADKAAASKLKALGEVAKGFGAFKPAHDILVRVNFVPTVFPHVNVVSKVGGWPTARFSLLHGESGDGKTKFGLGLGLSFLRAGGYYVHIDAEQTTPIDWPAQLFGDWAESPGFLASREVEYEKIRSEVRRFCDGFAEAKLKGSIEPKTPALILLDSIRKLVPKNVWDELTKEAEGKAKKDQRGNVKARGIDGMGGRAAQIKAALNAAWLDELIPLLAQTDVAFACVARQTIDTEGEVKIGGGAALIYDSSLRVEVERDGWITNGAENQKDEVIFGERHKVIVRKTKIAGREERWPAAYFHSSTGALEGVPAGFDRPRDIFDLGLRSGVVDMKHGGHYSFAGESLGQGANKVVRRLHADPTLLARLEAAALGADPPVEIVDPSVPVPARA